MPPSLFPLTGRPPGLERGASCCLRVDLSLGSRLVLILILLVSFYHVLVRLLPCVCMHVCMHAWLFMCVCVLCM